MARPRADGRYGLQGALSGPRGIWRLMSHNRPLTVDPQVSTKRTISEVDARAVAGVLEILVGGVRRNGNCSSSERGIDLQETKPGRAA